MKHYSIISLFPESIEPYLNSSILKRGQEKVKKIGSKAGRKAVIKIAFYDPKKFVGGKKTKNGTLKDRVDDKPYAGGPGMVLRAEPLLKAWERAVQRSKVPVGKEMKNKNGELKNDEQKNNKKDKTVTIFLSPQGQQFDQDMAKELAQCDHVIFFCGRYEGMDARIRDITNAREVSVGPFVLTGGELPAALMIDVIARHVPGVLGDFNSREDERTASPDVYTRPETLVWKKKKYTVPPVLLSGDHKKIEAWRREQRDAQ